MNYNMIRLAFLSLSCLILLGFSACQQLSPNSVEKEMAQISMEAQPTQATIEFVSTHLANSREEVAGKFWQKVKKWFHDHSGSHIQRADCGGNYHCGPCPGFCANIGKRKEVALNQMPTPTEYADGYRAYALTMLEDNAMLVSFVHTSDFVYNGNLHIEDNLEMGPAVAAAFGLNQITVQAGVYPVDFDEDPNGETVLLVTTN